MKKLKAYSLLLLLFSFCSSCIKESDILTESDPVVIHQEGETRMITGIVKDTSGSVLPGASVKVILDELALVTEADENGEWNLMVPIHLTDGFVVSNKIEYSKSIQRFKEKEGHVTDIYLASSQSNTDLDLSLVVGALKTVVGRIINENGSPIPGVTIFLVSLLEGTPVDFVLNGFVPTDGDGHFEIIYEDTDIVSSTLHTIFPNVCSDYLSYPLDGQDLIEDLGDLLLASEGYSIFETKLESDGSSCYENVTTLAYHYNLEAAFQSVVYDQPLGDITVEYCPKGNNAFYIGVENEDNSHFNGLFVTGEEAEDAYAFDICTPYPGNFLELNINGEVNLYQDVNLIAPEKIAITGQEQSLILSVQNWVTSTAIGGTKPRYQIGRLNSLGVWGGDIEFGFNIVEGTIPTFNYVNIVQDDDIFYAGIAQARLTTLDGIDLDVAIRFRVSK